MGVLQATRWNYLLDRILTKRKTHDLCPLYYSVCKIVSAYPLAHVQPAFGGRPRAW